MSNEDIFTVQKELDASVQLLLKAAEVYEEGIDEPSMDDRSYDLLLRKVRKTYVSSANTLHFNTNAVRLLEEVGGGQNPGGEVTHSVPMLSIENAMTPEELQAWFTRINKNLSPNKSATYVVEPKMDGIALSAHYVDGALIKIVTRGDGTRGRDVTANIKKVIGLPKTLKQKVTLEVRGEGVISREQFEILNAKRLEVAEKEKQRGKKNLTKPYMNARQGASGIVNTSKGDKETLSFGCYSLVAAEELGLTSHSEAMSYVESLGITTVRSLLDIKHFVRTNKEAIELVTQIENAREAFSFDIDGAVVKVNKYDLQDALGATAHSPRWAIARKYPADTRITKLLDITYLQTGKTGAITPVGILEPVHIAGVVVSKVSLHNFSDIARKDLRIGDNVTIRRAGDVIPQVVGVAGEHQKGTVPFVPPTKCPQCGGKIDKSQENWRCITYRQCGLVSLLVHAYGRHVYNIKGLGKRYINKMVEQGVLENVSDIFSLSEADLANINVGTESKLSLIGEVRARTIMEEVTKAKNTPLGIALAGLGITGLGVRMGNTIAKGFTDVGTLLAVLEKNDQQKFNTLVGDLGPILSTQVFEGLVENKDEIQRLIDLGLSLPTTKTTSNGSLAGESVVISGSVDGYTRKDLEEFVVARGGTFKTSVSRNVTLFVVGAKASSSKIKAAERLNIRTLSGALFVNRY